MAEFDDKLNSILSNPDAMAQIMQDSNARALLHALSPYLKPERQQKVDRALQLARLFHVGRQFLSKWEG